MQKDTATLDSILGSDTVHLMLTELGMSESPREEKEAFLGALGRNILQRVLLETLKALPEEDHAEFERLFDARDMAAMQKFIDPRIPDFEQFIQTEAMQEYESTKSRMREIGQGL